MFRDSSLSGQCPEWTAPRAAACLREPDPAAKCALVAALAEEWCRNELRPGVPPDWEPLQAPGRPKRPALVPPRALARRGLGDVRGRTALLHAIAHIEFNAINLALDAVQRFAGLPPAFHGDWISVAEEEARHFALVVDRLRALGADYGDLPAHDGLWQMAVATADDPLRRMALVPRVLEARGLDVTPGMITKLRDAGDDASADALDVILRDEVGHVAIGSRWFRWLCAERGLSDPAATYLKVLAEHFNGQVRCPLNLDARRRAGFDEAELDGLLDLCGEGRARPATAAI
ncbi:MAG: ferritin-like domain-containing protein [Thiohalocapsa sp. PB-PSB1]|nr:MAG: ferritin-like domain-containing protein [Thiohalocapsa sp. PB-PSB1]HCS90333.1 DUF455 domain-containing protein [Chromatiaceae bacterium]